MNCTVCGHGNPPAAKFCLECGSAFTPRCASCTVELPMGAKFCLECGTPVGAGATAPSSATGSPPDRSPADYTPSHLRERILQSQSALEGERKQVTVLFADVKGSMALAEQLDPEAWHGILDRFFRILTEAVHRFEGTVNQYTGDGIMALFGAPIAHEDHPQRACYAALHFISTLRELQDELRLAQGVDLAVRVGLHSGEVIVGKIGDDLRMDYTAQGHSVGIAQRMEAIAAANTILLSGATAERVTGYFTLRDLGAAELKGVSESIQVFQLEGIGRVRTRLDISQARGFSKFVGRREELDQLQAAKAQAAGGSGQVVGIVAEAGAGKSRLCHEFSQQCRSHSVSVYTAHGVPHGNAIPLYPILTLYRDALGLDDEDSDSVTRRKIAGALAQIDRDLLDMLPLFCDFLGVPDPGNPAPQIAAPERERRIIALLKRILQAGSALQTSVLLFEDLHWFDPASDRILESLIETIAGTRTLLIVNFRPEYSAEWMRRSTYRQLPLAPLTPEAIHDMLNDLLGDHESLAGLSDRIHHHTGGNPYFIEELVNDLSESGALEGTRGHYRLVRPVETIEIPASVQALLSARIDRLAERNKRVLQAGAVIGREFTQNVVARIADETDADLESALRALVQSEFLFETAIYPEISFAFRHPLTREVAYDSQLRDRRRVLHRRAATAMIEAHAEHLDEHAAVIAGHLEAADSKLEAARWHARAARCMDGLASTAELFHWTKVRELLPGDPLEGEALQLAAEAAGQIVIAGGRLGFSVEEFEAACEDALHLGHHASDQRIDALVYIARFLNQSYQAGSQDLDLAEAAYEAADRSGDPGVRLVAANYSGYTPRVLVTSLERVERGIQLANGDLSIGSHLVGISPLVVAHGLRARLLADMGRFPEALQEREHSDRALRELGDPSTEMISRINSSLVPQLYGDWKRGIADLRRVVDLGERLLAPNMTVLLSLLCRAHALNEDWEAAEAGLQQLGFAFPLVQGARAMLHLARGEAEAALEAADALAAQPEIYWQLAEFRLTRARALLALGGGDARTAVEAEIELVASWLDRLGAEGQKPVLSEVRAELSRVSGDEGGWRREMEKAVRGFEQLGAKGQAERVVRRSQG